MRALIISHSFDVFQRRSIFLLYYWKRLCAYFKVKLAVLTYILRMLWLEPWSWSLKRLWGILVIQEFLKLCNARLFLMVLQTHTNIRKFSFKKKRVDTVAFRLVKSSFSQAIVIFFTFQTRRGINGDNWFLKTNLFDFFSRGLWRLLFVYNWTFKDFSFPGCHIDEWVY